MNKFLGLALLGFLRVYAAEMGNSDNEQHDSNLGKTTTVKEKQKDFDDEYKKSEAKIEAAELVKNRIVERKDIFCCDNLTQYILLVNEKV